MRIGDVIEIQGRPAEYTRSGGRPCIGGDDVVQMVEVALHLRAIDAVCDRPDCIDCEYECIAEQLLGAGEVRRP